jgi:hypothetical protein
MPFYASLDWDWADLAMAAPLVLLMPILALYVLRCKRKRKSKE